MSKLKVADFYYGAILSLLFNNKVTPALVESGEDRQVYDFTTNHIDFRLFVKYRAERTSLKSEEYYSWTFTLLNDYKEITGYINDGYNVLLALVCGNSDLKDSELAILQADDIAKILSLEKKSITISRKKRERSFRIAVGGGRDNSIVIKSNAIDQIFGNNTVK